MLYQYSDIEMKLLCHFFAEGKEKIQTTPPSLAYIGCVWQAFTYPHKYHEEYIDALQWAAQCLDRVHQIHRLTPEFNGILEEIMVLE